jgi:2-polyprenyl-3-methyl-5-hydroxy-6-metoxy-1,4-benzoquinol methylase
MSDPVKRDIWNRFQKIREITASHIPDKSAMRFDYDCRLYREGTLRDLALVRSRLSMDHAKLLDVGCGFGGISCALSAIGLDVHGIDVEETASYYGHFKLTKNDFIGIWRDLERQHRGVQLQFYKPYRFPFEDESFDTVLFYAVLEHIPTEQALLSLQEAHRVLKPGGTVFIFRCPSDLSWTEKMCRILGIPGHDTLYGEKALKEMVEKGPFRIMEFEKTDLFPAFFPVRFQWVLDSQGFWLIPLQDGLLKTPLRRWAHHFQVVAKKI